MVELILIEILAVPADRSRGKHRPRVVKRKMSSFPTKSRAAPGPRQAFHYAEQIRIVAPKEPDPAQRPPPRARRPCDLPPPADTRSGVIMCGLGATAASGALLTPERMASSLAP